LKDRIYKPHPGIIEKQSTIYLALEQYLNERGMPSFQHDPITHSLLGASKYIRSIFMLQIFESFGKDWKKYVNICVPFEILHTATLIHDDLPSMDNANKRRGRESCHIKYGEAAAVLAGDFLFADSLRYFITSARNINLSNARIVEIVSILSTGLSDITAGQALELYLKFHTVSIDDCFEIIKKKTACFFQMCFKICGITMEIKRKKLEILAEAGNYIGIAFQLTDDVLDLYGAEKNEGKNIGADGRNGIRTIPAIEGLDRTLEYINSATGKAVSILNKVISDQSPVLHALNYAITNRLPHYDVFADAK